MNAWSTFALVPPIAPSAWLRAVAAIAAFVLVERAATVGRVPGLTPLAAAFCVSFLFTLAGNLHRTVAALRRDGGSVAGAFGVAAAMLCGLVWIGLGGEWAVTTAWSGYFGMHALALLWLARYAPEATHRVLPVWAGAGRAVPLALRCQAVTLAVIGASLAGLARLDGTFLFAVAATFGVLAVHFLGSWLTVLVLLDEGDG